MSVNYDSGLDAILRSRPAAVTDEDLEEAGRLLAANHVEVACAPVVERTKPRKVQRRRTVSMPGPTYARLQALSKREGIPMAAMVQDLIERMCDAKGIPGEVQQVPYRRQSIHNQPPAHLTF